MMKMIRKFFLKRATTDEMMDVIISRTTFGEEGDHLMEDARTVFGRAGRDPMLAEWIGRRKASLLKYATIEGYTAVIKNIIGEYDMILRFIGTSVHIPRPDAPDREPELKTVDDITKAWEESPFRKINNDVS